MTCSCLLFTIFVLTAMGSSLLGQDRMPAIPTEKMSDAQRQAVDEFEAGRGSPPFGPFIPLLRSPEVMLRTKALGDYLRFKSILPAKLRELAILATAREWSQQFEWNLHAPIALKAGLSPDLVKSLAQGVHPVGMTEDEGIVYEFCVELHRRKTVKDAIYNKARAKLGEQGVIELVSLNGYYTFLAMVLNVARTPSQSEGEPDLLLYPRHAE